MRLLVDFANTNMLSNDQVLNKGRYRIVDSFGADGSGTSYDAYDTVSNTSVVLTETIGNMGKVTTFSQMEAINTAFLGGAKSLAEIKHDSIVNVQDYFAEIDRQYLVLEPVSGFALSKFIPPGEERPKLYTVLDWADKLLDALHFLHTHSTPIIHGDIRPENVKITSDSSVKLLTSFAHTDNESGIVSLAPARASEGGINYRPLEQLWSGLDSMSRRLILNHYDEEAERTLLQPVNAATDIYSLGATIYAVLTGNPPPDALDRSIAAIEHKPDPMADLTNSDENIPAEIADVVMNAMALRREDRFYSAVIFRQVLRTAAVRVKERETKEKGNVYIPAVEAATETIPASTANVVPENVDTNTLRMEIKAEEERLEQERQELERRRCELDAKMELQKSEEDRMNRETAEAQVKIEQTRLAVESKNVVKLLEAERRENDAKADREAFNTPFGDIKAVGTDPLEDDIDLLEIPSAPPPKKAPDEQKIYESKAFEAVFSGMLNEKKARPAWQVPAMAAGFLALAIGGIGVWKLSSSNEPAPPPAAVMNAAPQTESPATPIVTRSSTETPVNNDQAASTSETPEKQAAKPAQVASVQDKPAAQDKMKKQPAPTPAKTAPAKKTITVDDLINDH